jgi:hypothetical protein
MVRLAKVIATALVIFTTGGMARAKMFWPSAWALTL